MDDERELGQLKEAFAYAAMPGRLDRGSIGDCKPYLMSECLQEPQYKWAEFCYDPCGLHG